VLIKVCPYLITYTNSNLTKFYFCKNSVLRFTISALRYLFRNCNFYLSLNKKMALLMFTCFIFDGQIVTSYRAVKMLLSIVSFSFSPSIFTVHVRIINHIVLFKEELFEFPTVATNLNSRYRLRVALRFITFLRILFLVKPRQKVILRVRANDKSLST
jgi:hypothetical protein